MELQQLIEKWTKEMDDIKIHIKKHEDTFGHPAVPSRERLEAISDMLADIKQLKISSNPLLCDSVCDDYDPEIAFPSGNGKCKNCGKYHDEQTVA